MGQVADKTYAHMKHAVGHFRHEFQMLSYLVRHGLVHRCNGLKEEDDLGKATKTADAMGAKSLCIPFDQPELTESIKCFFTSEPAQNWTLFGRSY